MSTVKDIGVNPFFGCMSIGKIQIDYDNESCAYVNSTLYSKNKTNIVFVNDDFKDKDYIVEPSVKKIGNYAFENTRNILTVSGDAELEIGDYAFLESYVESVKLTNAISIGYEAFAYCPNLVSVYLPNAKVISDETFRWCESLEYIDISAVESMNGSIFVGCYSIKTIKISENNEKYTLIGNIVYSKDLNTLVLSYPYNSLKGEFIIPDGVKNVGDFAFYEFNDIEKLDLNNVRNVGECAFAYCDSLKSVIMENVQSIGDEAFYMCSSIQ